MCLTVCAALAAPAPAAAIIDGQPDTSHTYVGTLVAAVPGYGAVAFCSGTLISGTSFVTAGHCLTDLNGATLLGVSFALDPFAGPIPAGLVGIDDFHVYPGFALPDVFTDVAVVHLETSVPGPYGVLPTLGLLEPLESEKPAADITFTVVGYGWQQFVPHSAGLGVRRFTTSRLQSFQYPTSPPGKGDASTSSLLKLQKLPGTQGTVCYSDSGGPLFHGVTNVVSAITVGGTKNCTGQHYGLRLDTMPVQSFLLSPFH